MPKNMPYRLYVKIDEFGDVLASSVTSKKPGDDWYYVPNDGKHGPTTLVARPKQYRFTPAGSGTVNAHRRRAVQMALGGTVLTMRDTLRVSVRGILHGESVRILVDDTPHVVEFGKPLDLRFTSPGLVKVRMKDENFFDTGRHRGSATVRVVHA